MQYSLSRMLDKINIFNDLNQISIFTIIPKISYTATVNMDNGPPISLSLKQIPMHFNVSQIPLALARRTSGVKYLVNLIGALHPHCPCCSCETQTPADLQRIRLTPFLTYQSIQILVLMLISKGIIHNHFHFHT